MGLFGLSSLTRRVGLLLIAGALLPIALASGGYFAGLWPGRAEKRVRVVIPGLLVRGAWQDPDVLRRLIARERIKTIVTLAAINRDDSKFVSQAKVVSETGVRWIIVPMRGSTATLAQMARAADLLADPALQPVFFHCVAGHHRTSLAHAAYLIRHRGWTAQSAWEAMANLPWARPAAAADQRDRALIEEFANVQGLLTPTAAEGRREVHDDDEDTIAQNCRLGLAAGRGTLALRPLVCGLGPGNL
jgi:protein tyrosine phosphatase (PTP) superfamily phosphohydrolase (DUF442 family)